MPQRLQQLNTWLQRTLNLPEYDIKPASSDASFRRYFRITPKQGVFNRYQVASLVVMDAPPSKENTEPFVRLAGLLTAMGLNVPIVVEQNTELGFLLLTDLGSQQYLSVLSDSNVDSLYADALDALLLLQTHGAAAIATVPAYDFQLLSQELEIFREWYLIHHLGLQLTDQQSQIIDQTFGVLCDTALEQPTVLVHRDYHSRNLMLTDKCNPGMLDFQDAVAGPFSYDLVSLLKDCYIAWPRERVEAWAVSFMQKTVEAGILTTSNRADYLRWFDLMGVQRHLKAVGIFARLQHRDGKSQYLKEIPRTLSYVVDVSGRYDELHALNGFLTTQLPVGRLS
ncbi:MAG: phosphotransferase [Gammaproteobacteria bacterium]|nr:phosphotransferase [Gammaproteobacteria bacterium]